MFNPIAFIRTIFIVVVLLAVLFTATKFSPPIKQNLSGVLGVKIEENSAPLPEKLQEDVDASIKDVTKKAMETDTEDIVDLTSRVNKIITDYHMLQEELKKKVDEFLNEKKK